MRYLALLPLLSLAGCELLHHAVYAKKAIVMACVNESKTQTNGPACTNLGKWYSEHPEAE
jgi:hypothetical protein